MTFTVANIITAFNAKSGGPPRTVSLIAAAGKGHWRAELFTTDYVESSSDRLLVDGFPGHVNVLPSHSQTLFGGFAMLIGVDRTFRSQLHRGVAPDVVHIHGLWNPYLAAYAREAHRNGLPYVVAPHGMLEPWSLSVRRLRKTLALKSYQGQLLARASAIHATSELEANHLRQILGTKVPIFIIPNAVEPSTSSASEIPGREDRRTLLFLSRIHEKKGLDMLVQAWGALQPKGWRLLIVGSGEPNYVQRLKTYCTANRIGDVEFRDHVEGEEKEAVFRSASVFVLPTFSENFGNVVGEALIRGVPVITTAGTPWSEIAQQGCGWYIEPALDALTAALVEALNTEPETLRRMGARGRDYAMARFSLQVVRDALLKLYQAAIESRATQRSH